MASLASSAESGGSEAGDEDTLVSDHRSLRRRTRVKETLDEEEEEVVPPLNEQGNPPPGPFTCLACRAKRRRCDKYWPCGRCRELGLECIMQTRGRGRPPTRKRADGSFVYEGGQPAWPATQGGMYSGGADPRLYQSAYGGMPDSGGQQSLAPYGAAMGMGRGIPPQASAEHGGAPPQHWPGAPMGAEAKISPAPWAPSAHTSSVCASTLLTPRPYPGHEPWQYGGAAEGRLPPAQGGLAPSTFGGMRPWGKDSAQFEDSDARQPAEAKGRQQGGAWVGVQGVQGEVWPSFAPAAEGQQVFMVTRGGSVEAGLSRQQPHISTTGMGQVLPPSSSPPSPSSALCVAVERPVGAVEPIDLAFESICRGLARLRVEEGVEPSRCKFVSQTIDFLFRIAEEDFVGVAYLRLLNEVVKQAEERGPVQHLLKRGRDGAARWSTEPVSSSSSSSDLQANSAAAWGPRSSSYDMEVVEELLSTPGAACMFCCLAHPDRVMLAEEEVRCNALMVERYFSVEEVCKAAGQLRTVIPSVLARIMTPESIVKFFEAFPRVYIPDQNGRETNCVVELCDRHGQYQQCLATVRWCWFHDRIAVAFRFWPFGSLAQMRAPIDARGQDFNSQVVGPPGSQGVDYSGGATVPSMPSIARLPATSSELTTQQFLLQQQHQQLPCQPLLQQQPVQPPVSQTSQISRVAGSPWPLPEGIVASEVEEDELAFLDDFLLLEGSGGQ